jgi:CDGSH-type Zn-finger protein
LAGWQNRPFEIQAKESNTIAFCMCGKSQNGPFCDGSHKGSGISPKVVTYDKDTTLHVCGCQKSKNRPLCDGTHKTITD